MKTERRHELQTNDLAIWLTDAVETGKPYAKLAAGIVLAAGVLIVFYLVMSGRTKQAEQRGWKSYFLATASQENDDLEQVAKDYPSAPVGYWANLSLGDRYLAEGINDRFNDRAKSEEELRQAVQHYSAARAPSEPLLAQRAGFGLARAYETQQELDKAREEYRALKEQWANSVYGELAGKRLADLDRQSTKEFYDWFARQEPKPPSAGDGLLPGGHPPLDQGGEGATPDLGPGDSGATGPLSSGAAEPSESTPATSTEPPAATEEPASSGEPAPSEHPAPSEEPAPNPAEAGTTNPNGQ